MNKNPMVNPIVPQLRRATQLEKESHDALIRADGKPGLPVMADRLPPGTSGHPSEQIVTNVYGIAQKKDDLSLYRYDVRIYGICKNDVQKELELTGPCSDEYIRIERRTKCREIFVAFQEQQSNSLFRGVFTACDLHSILYTDVALQLEKDGKEFRIDCGSFAHEDFSRLLFCRIALKPVGNSPDFNLSDLKNVLRRNLDDYDRSYAQYIDIVTAQHVIFNPEEHLSISAAVSYLMNPDMHGFSSDDLPVFQANLSYLSAGCHKSTRFIEGPNGMGHIHTGMVVAVKKTSFHALTAVDEKARCYVTDLQKLDINRAYELKENDIKKLGDVFKGLYVQGFHGKREIIKILSVIKDSADTISIDINGYEVTVAKYFQEKYNITLVHSNYPLLTARRGGKICHYPMEQFLICDNQQVRESQQLPKVMEEMIKCCAIPPAKLREQINSTVKSLHVNESDLLSRGGLRFIANPLNMNTARVIPAPSMLYDNEKVSVTRHFNWLEKRYLVPKTLKNWYCYAIVDHHETLRRDDIVRFIKSYIESAMAKGMVIAEPKGMTILTNHEGKIREMVELVQKDSCELFMLIQSNDDAKTHAELKFAERKYGITTQGINASTVTAIASKGQPTTVTNILNKTNVKLGGVNYSLSLDSPASHKVLAEGTLIIGIAANHPRYQEQDIIINGKLNGNGQSNGINGIRQAVNGTRINGGVNGNGINGSGRAVNGNAINGNGRAVNGINGANGAKVSPTKESSRFPPSIIGYSANVGISDPFEFIGDFLLQEPRRDEKPEKICKIVQRCVKQYKSNRGGADVGRIIIYRNGCDEGQFQQILKYEIPFIKVALRAVGCTAKFAVIVPNKLHHVRFFKKEINPNDSPPNQNIQPGTVIDQSIVHASYCEFYLNSHRALQGTARTPRYTLIYDELNLSMNDMQEMTYQLCYGHQIVNSPTSLPSPAYIANCYADRGRTVFNEWLATIKSDVDENAKYDDIEAILCYFEHEKFANLRINA